MKKTVLNYSLQVAGSNKVGISWDVTIPETGQFVGLLSQRPSHVKVYFNANCTRGSLKKFDSLEEAIQFIHNRRIKRGWPTA